MTEMGWPVEPEVLTDLLMRVHREYAPARILITENGAAYEDVVGADGRIDDTARVAYLRDHVRAALRAKEAGVPFEGYFVWSLLDNFEWAQGYLEALRAGVRRLRDAGAYTQVERSLVPAGRSTGRAQRHAPRARSRSRGRREGVS